MFKPETDKRRRSRPAEVPATYLAALVVTSLISGLARRLRYPPFSTPPNLKCKAMVRFLMKPPPHLQSEMLPSPEVLFQTLSHRNVFSCYHLITIMVNFSLLVINSDGPPSTPPLRTT